MKRNMTIGFSVMLLSQMATASNLNNEPHHTRTSRSPEAELRHRMALNAPVTTHMDENNTTISHYHYHYHPQVDLVKQYKQQRQARIMKAEDDCRECCNCIMLATFTSMAAIGLCALSQ